MIYFVQAGETGPIKIGTCRPEHLDGRIRNLQTGCWLTLTVRLAVEPGGRELESRLHSLFSDDWIDREWFYPSEAVLGLIRSGVAVADTEEAFTESTKARLAAGQRVQDALAELGMTITDEPPADSLEGRRKQSKRRRREIKAWLKRMDRAGPEGRRWH